MNNVQLEQIGIVMILAGLAGLVVIGKIICEEFGVNKLIVGMFGMVSAIITIILTVAGQ